MSKLDEKALDQTTREYPNLSPEKESAIFCLATGMSFAKTARKIGKPKSTIWYWYNKDLAFKMAVDEQKNRRCLEIKQSVLSLIEDARNVVHEAIKQGDVETALPILLKSGAINIPELNETKQETKEEKEEKIQEIVRVLAKLRNQMSVDEAKIIEAEFKEIEKTEQKS